ncbi:hypothetical protein E2C01_001687 [Portunus trituberculatus]|uniref:Uncharacterized protein n=1 Tax=Portunus trituberculatus TaxID=210409 RepID=A0A5B7CK22_PORTR|nr:hypothetical protein [Portunus trituberculatus]
MVAPGRRGTVPHTAAVLTPFLVVSARGRLFTFCPETPQHRSAPAQHTCLLTGYWTPLLFSSWSSPRSGH